MTKIEICMYCAILICMEILIGFIACAIRDHRKQERWDEFRRRAKASFNVFQKQYFFNPWTNSYFVADMPTVRRLAVLYSATSITKMTFDEYRKLVIDKLAE